MAVGRQMRTDWDARAREDAMYYIDTRRTSWDASSFYREGRREALDLVGPALDRLGFDPAGRRLLEIGCGIGRLFPGFADLFGDVWGIDVSPEMVRQGREQCPVPAQFVLGSGEDLRTIGTASVDYCFSYIVFQHIGNPHVVWRYVEEVERVLRPGGAFQLHFRASSPLRSRMIQRMPSLLRRLVRRLRRRPDAGDVTTWTGAAVSRQEVTARLEGLALSEIAIIPCTAFDFDSFWAIGRKPGGEHPAKVRERLGARPWEQTGQ